MRRLLLFFATFFAISLYSQCPPAGQIVLSSQERVDSFVETYRNCERIIGDLIIINAVSNLDDEGATNTEVNDISKIDFIKAITGNLIININVPELNSFENLLEVRGDIEITNSPALKKISGFRDLISAGSITIALNNNLENVDGFNELKRLEKSLEIGFSDNLIRIDGFNSLQSLGKELNISYNRVLVKIPSFNTLEKISNDLNLTSNPKLMLVEGFEKLNEISNDLNIESVEKIIGFSSLKKIGRDFRLTKNTIKEIPSFENLISIGGNFRILNTGIYSIQGFYNLEKVGHLDFLENNFIFQSNLKLESIVGFGKFIFVDGDVDIKDNIKLSDCSWLCFLIKNGEITGNFKMQNNLGDCLSPQKIIEICNPDFDNDLISDVIDLDDDNDGILDKDEGNGFLDTDGDGFPDSKDLDSDNDNCFDVIEAGYKDPNSDGILGVLPVKVDSNGLITTSSTGFTDPIDINSNGIKDFQEVSTLNPGKNNIIELCPKDIKVDLFTQLNGTPDLGGFWTPELISGTSIFDPTVDKAGIYTYTHIHPICGERSAQIYVSILNNTSAGINSEVLICDKKLINLFDYIDGNPTSGGTWNPELESGGNMFDPSKDKAGEYRYTVIDENCGPISSKLLVKLSSKPNAGVGKSIQICEFSQSINLFDLLEGNPDTTGTWHLESNNLNVTALVSGEFNPKVNTSGKYIYTVDKGSCGVDKAEVTVEVLKDNPLNNVTIKVNDFSSKNNSIQVFVASEREYEYSLDGVNYQISSVFNQVSGGYQTVYVRGADGCEFYKETVFVKSYPAFFTPNNDGVNDFWRLDNFPNVKYQIYIYTRFGKLIKEIPSITGFWDGTYQGRNLESSDYWFKVVTENGEVFYGNFSLLRK